VKLSIAKFTAIFIFLMVLVSPLSYVCAELQFPPHDDPGSAPVNVDPVFLMNYYSSLFQFISKSDYSGFKELFASNDLTFLPASLQGLFNSFSAELNRANSNMQQIDQLLTNSSSLLDQNRRSEANQTLYEASITIGGTEIILNQLGNTTLSIGDQLGVTTTPANSPSRQALAGLQNSIKTVQNQLNNYLMLFQTLMTRYYATSDNGTTATSIMLQLNVSVASVGTNVAFYGRLTSNGSSLPGRNATLLLDGNIIASAVTDSNGSYSSYFSVPFDYVRQVMLFALFIPEGIDALDYISSISEPVYLNVLYKTTNIEVNIPNTGYPGLTFPIQGNVTSDNGTPLEGRTISIYIDNTTIVDLYSGSHGDFSSNYAIPANSITGSHQLNIYVAPQGTFAGTSLSETFSIDRYPLNLTLSYPPTVYLPTSFTVEGNVSSALGRLDNATVTISVGNTTKIVKTVDGSFSATFDLPLSPWPAGNQLLSITVEPAEPWHASLEVSNNVFVWSPIAVTAISGASLLIVAFSILWIRRNRLSRKSSSPVEQGAEGTVISQAPLEPPMPSEIPAFDGGDLALPVAKSIQNIQIGLLSSERQKVIQSYARAWRLVERTTGVLMEPNTTINEFLQIASARLNGAKDPFSCLTALAERSLYSQFDPVLEDVSLAETYSRTIEEAFKYGSA
jgi:hypothetical protein